VNRESVEALNGQEQKQLFAVAESVAAKELEVALVEKHSEIEAKRAHANGLPKPEPRRVYKKLILEADPEVVGLIDEIKSLLSHTVVDGDLNQLLREALPLAIRELKIKKGLIKRNADPKHESSELTSSLRLPGVKFPGAKKISRSIPNAIKREVRKRDQGQCQYRKPGTETICGSTFQVEFDHLKPWSFNGEHSL
jgi:hypothetical protein